MPQSSVENGLNANKQPFPGSCRQPIITFPAQPWGAPIYYWAWCLFPPPDLLLLALLLVKPVALFQPRNEWDIHKQSMHCGFYELNNIVEAESWCSGSSASHQKAIMHGLKCVQQWSIMLSWATLYAERSPPLILPDSPAHPQARCHIY